MGKLGRHSLILLVILFNITCQGAPIRLPMSACSQPISDQFWKSANTNEVGFNSEPFCQMLRDSVAETTNLHSLLIERNGKLIVEIYQNGTDSPLNVRYGFRFPFSGDSSFDTQTLHDVRSVSKSVVSLLFGIAIDKKLAPEIDSSVLKSFPELSSLNSEGRDSITWRHLLTMSSGLDWDEWGHSFLTSDEIRLSWKNDLVHFVLDRPMIRTAGKTFDYNGGSTAILAEVLTKTSGKSLSTLSKEWLFDPLNIKEYEWATDFHDRALAFAGLRLRPRDMLKLGRLMLNGGVWEKKQIVPKKWVLDSLKPQISTNITMFSGNGSPIKYGYQWWVGETHLHDRTISWQTALGNGGQRIYLIPELDMVVVTTAGEYGALGIHKEIAVLLDKIIGAAD